MVGHKIKTLIRRIRQRIERSEFSLQTRWASFPS